MEVSHVELNICPQLNQANLPAKMSLNVFLAPKAPPLRMPCFQASRSVPKFSSNRHLKLAWFLPVVVNSRTLMKLTFQLRFHTEYGQSILLTGNHGIFGNDDIQKALRLEYLNETFWRTTIILPPSTLPDEDIAYNYVLQNADGSLIYDWGNDKAISRALLSREEVLIIDSWNHAGFYENAFYTEPFKEVLLRANHTEVPATLSADATHIFKVKAPLLPKGETLCLLGNNRVLGNWNTAKPVLLSRKEGEDSYSAQLNLDGEIFPVAYKYGVYNVQKEFFVRYEDRSDRSLGDVVAARKLTLVNDGFASLPCTTWKGAGVAIPVFSLRSESGFGIGEFQDIKLLADWGKQVGLKLIQILPINDTTATHSWLDSYPYASISAFALNPVYLNLRDLAQGQSKQLLAGLESERKRLNALETVDYAAVSKAKLAFTKQVYPLQKVKTFQSADYQRFFEANKHWLVPYAVFCHLRDKHGTADFTQWPDHQRCNAEQANRLAAENSAAHDEIAFNYFVQYHLHLQLKDAAEYTHSHGLILKGDIPIGVSRSGVDSWQQPELYRMELQAGAPPDAFSAKGQNWGFPIYNWHRMQEDGFAWWKRRFEQMGRYFDAFRIDHILGFFRIWSIPLHAVEGILGYFVPATPVELGEFASRGIAWDRVRYTSPFITDQVLRDAFGDESELVKNRFLISHGPHHFSLKPEFATQRQVERHFAALEASERNEKLKIGLYDLISNVILFEVEGSRGRQYHFRFGIESTASFKNLEPRTREQLMDLYVNYFYRRQDGFWMKEARQKLPALKRATNMLVCGEDLGMVPACVPDVMRELGLLSLEIQRMPKDPKREFFQPKSAPYLSVVTPSSHDMSTIRGWWEEDRHITQAFYNHELGEKGAAPLCCEAWLNKAVVVQHLSSPAMWSIFQLQDLLGIDEHLRRENPADERINVPANPKHYWRYRMHLSLETLKQAQGFNAGLKELLQQNGR